MGALIPVIVVFIIIYGIVKGVSVFQIFCEGAVKGVKTIVSIAPTIIGLITAVLLLRESGAIEILTSIVSPVAEALGFPAEIVPVALLRPVSGGGSTALLIDIFETHGPDSMIGKIVSVMAGSTETTFYAVSVYFSSIGVKKIRHTLVAGLMADLTAVIFSVLIVKLFYT